MCLCICGLAVNTVRGFIVTKLISLLFFSPLPSVFVLPSFYSPDCPPSSQGLPWRPSPSPPSGAGKGVMGRQSQQEPSQGLKMLMASLFREHR